MVLNFNGEDYLYADIPCILPERKSLAWRGTMKLLIIDNNQDDRVRIKQDFQKDFYGLEFLEIHKREDFDEVIGKGAFDAVITDYRLDWTDGLWILRSVKERFPSVPVIMLTDHGNEEIAVEGMKSGLSDYILKRKMHRLPMALKKSLRDVRLDNGHNRSGNQAKVSQGRSDITETISDYAYTVRVESNGAFLCECVTAAFTPTTGYTLEEIKGHDGWYSLVCPEDKALFLQHRNCLLSGQSKISEFRIITKNGEMLWLRDYAQPVWGDAQGRVIHIYGTAQNITELKLDDGALQDIEATYRKLIETAHGSLSLTDAESGIIIDVNQGAEALLGYSRKELIGMHYTQLCPEEEATSYAKMHDDCIHIGTAFTKELSLRHKMGHKIPAELHASVIAWGKKKVVQNIFQDITERKRAEERIRLYVEILDNVQIGMVVWQLENVDDIKTYKLIAANTAATQCTGVALGDLIGKTMTECFSNLMGTEVPQIYAEVVRSGKVKRLKDELFTDKVNSSTILSVKAFPLSNNCVGVAFVDITENEKIHEELKIFQLLFSEIRDLAYICDTQGNILYVNKIFEKLTGHKPEEFIGKPFSPLFDEENLKKAIDFHTRTVGGESLQFELRFKDTGIVCEYRNFQLRDGNGKVLRTIGIARDVTERRRAEEALQEAHKRLTSVLDGLNAVVYVADLKTHEILYANKYLKDLVGNVTGKICWETFQANQVKQCNFCTNDKLLDANGNPTGIYSWEFQNTLDGRWYAISDRAITWVDGCIVRLEIATDISMRKQAEESLRETNQVLQALIQASPLAIITLDLQGNVTMWNQAAEHLFGWKEREVLGHFLPIVPHNKQEEFRALRERVLQGESFAGVEVRRQKQDGSPVDISLSTAPLRDGQGNVKGIMRVLADITHLKQTQVIDALFHEIDQFVLQGQPPDFILPYVCTCLTDIFAYPLVWIGMKEANGTVSISAQAGTHGNYLKDFHPRWNEVSDHKCFIGLAIRTGKTRSTLDAQEAVFQRCRERACQYGLQSFLAVPLFSEGKVIGTLNLYDQKTNAFDAKTIHLLENLADRISITLLIARDQQQLRLHSAAMASVANAVFITDSEGRITWVNAAFAKLSGYTSNEACGLTPRLFKSGKHDAAYYQQVWQTILAGNVFRGEVINRHKNGGLYTVNQTITPLLDLKGKTRHFVAIHEDITDKKEAEKQIVYMAHYDTLTNLPNRILFADRLRQEVIHANRNKRLASVIFLDLDRFKTINDTLGHAFGDLLLKALADRLKDCIREGDTVSRLGGDEFIFIISDILYPQDAALIAQKILRVLSAAFHLDGLELHVTASIGIAIYPFDANDMENLIKKADIAMYHAKEQGGNVFKFYREDMNINNLERLMLENDLRKALTKGELVVYYQPLVSLDTGQIMSMEALIRWQHPTLGMLYPAKFIPIAEETGLIVLIGEWVLKTACAQTRAWHDAGFPTFRITVNLSVRQFKQQNLVNMITRVLQETCLDPKYLELELTEGIVMQNDMAILAVLRELKSVGVLFSIDDFGTEYSSLSYLKRFPVDTIKIDRSFVQDITTNPDDAAIVTAIIAVAKSLKLKIVAEGVENKEQADFLRELHCNNIQGYLYSQPLSPADIDRLLQKGIRMDAKSP